MPTIGWLSRLPPIEPKKPASPKAKTPPSMPASHSPAPPAVAAAAVIRCESLTVTPGKAGAVVVGHPVAVAGRRGGHADDVVALVVDRAGVAGRAEGEDAAVGGVEPVPAGARGRRRPHRPT